MHDVQPPMFLQGRRAGRFARFDDAKGKRDAGLREIIELHHRHGLELKDFSPLEIQCAGVYALECEIKAKFPASEFERALLPIHIAHSGGKGLGR